MPRINPDDYIDHDSDDDLEIQEDEPRTAAGRTPQSINRPTRQDLDWEERRRQLQRNKLRRGQDQ